MTTEPTHSNNQSRVARFRELLGQEGMITAPGVYDALSASLAEQAGFPLLHATGAGISCVLGYPDIGLLSVTEVIEQVSRMVDATSAPILADADTGYGNSLNVIRTVRSFEKAGAAGIHIEDQVFPKKCGLLAGREVVPVQEIQGKIQAALDARVNEEFVIVARTDARDSLDLDAVIERGNAFHEAGADMVFVYGARSLQELEKIAKEVPGPLMTHVSKGAAFSDVSSSDLEALGYKLVIHALSPLEVAAYALREYLRELRATGSSSAEAGRMLSYQELYGSVGLNTWLDLEEKYAGTETPGEE